MKITVDTRGLTLKKDIKRVLKSSEKKTLSSFSRQAANIMKKDVVKTIVSGNSPVKGYRRFQGYSRSYREAIRKGRYKVFNKRQRPVNLKLSGKMLKSIAGRVTNNGFVIFFTSKLAKIHNELGAGRSRAIRRLLPTKSNEQFKASVVISAKAVLTKAMERILAKNLRRL